MPFNSISEIDAKHVANSIEGDIQKLLNANSAKGVIIGLSGGIDSAVLAALAVRSLGPERVDAYHLYDRDSAKESRRKAQFIANWLGIKLKHHNITPTMRKMKIYSPLIMKIITLSGFINRCLNTNLHRLFHWEPPFISTLRRDYCNGYRIKRLFYKWGVGSIEAAFNARHVYRRKFLEQQAEEKNWLVLGAANQSELMVGWFVKDGIDDMPFSPIKGLYKTHVLQLAKYLLPREIQNQAPSPDMVKGVTDECFLGVSYDTIDIILNFMKQNMSDQEIIASGISKKDLRLVRNMNRLSAWKRKPENVDRVEREHGIRIKVEYPFPNIA